MSALLKVKNHVSVSQQKVFWKNQTFSSLSGNVKLVMAILTVLAIEADMAIVRLLRLLTDTQPKGSVRLPVEKDGSTCGRLGWSDEPVGINQLDIMIVDPSVLEESGSQVRREHISKVRYSAGTFVGASSAIKPAI